MAVEEVEGPVELTRNESNNETTEVRFYQCNYSNKRHTKLI